MVSADDAVAPPPPTTVSSSSSYYSYNPSLIIIAGILAFVCIASAAIHFLLRFLSRSTSPRISSATTSTTNSSSSDPNPKSLLDTLPLFTLASSLSTLPKSSPDCAVCLSRFQPHDQLRLLPACRHAFHSPCIDTWLQTTPSCPLCRSSIHLPTPPPPPPQPTDDRSSASESFRLEIGSVSRRSGAATPSESPTPPPHDRSYSLGSSFEYRVEEEVDAVIARVMSGKDGRPRHLDAAAETLAPEAEVAGGGSKGWLREYVDRLASSASSSFSSLRFSSRRFDVDDGGDGGGRGEGWYLESDGWIGGVLW